MLYNITERVKELRDYFDALLDERIAKISELSGVDASKMIKINPADFIEKNKYQQIDGYEYEDIGDWIKRTKMPDNYLISPLDSITETASQISYKEKVDTVRIRASKCKMCRIPSDIALDFYDRNHRQTIPNLRQDAITFGILLNEELVGCMTFDKANGAVRGNKKHYELMRLAFKKGISVAGGASRLHKYCCEALVELGEQKVFSYSNATINEGRVYAALGYKQCSIERGQPFVILRNNKLSRLISLYPDTTDEKLAKAGRITTHISGNKLWTKDIQ